MLSNTYTHLKYLCIRQIGIIVPVFIQVAISLRHFHLSSKESVLSFTLQMSRLKNDLSEFLTLETVSFLLLFSLYVSCRVLFEKKMKLKFSQGGAISFTTSRSPRKKCGKGVKTWFLKNHDTMGPIYTGLELCL